MHKDPSAGLIRVLVVDDHPVFRDGTRRLLEELPDIGVVADAGDGVAAVELARTLRPDVVILDIRLPRLNGVEATRQILRAVPDARVLVLTAYDDDAYVFALMNAGALGYMLKTASGPDLVEAVRAVHRGDAVLHPAIARKVARYWGQAATLPRTETRASITSREVEVLDLVAQGLHNKEVAERLRVSTRTVETHLERIFAKLGVSSRTEAVMLALTRRLLHTESKVDEAT